MRNLDNSYYSTDQDIHFRMTTPEEERELFRKAKDEGCEKSREFIIRNHLLFAAMTAQKQVRGALPKNEAISAANFAVMKAYEGFDYRKGFRFSTYLRPFIQGEISQLWKTKFSGPGIADPSLGGGIDSYQDSLRSVQGNSNSSGVEELGRLGHKQAYEVSGHVMHADHDFEEIDFKQYEVSRLTAALKTLTDKDAALLRMHYQEERSFADIARGRGVSREAVRATHARLITKLKRLLK